ncbi:MAG: MiaB/RimO family radical SAM methylthiotransferase, partial [Gemmatimonadota bacterium]|nr:MiaB/RimO family radical SAM methylthiotransferase [Gemmatimonadota bacterium]
NDRCTFCSVPYVRGPEKNRDPDEVLDEVRRVARDGITEVTLLGQTVNSYSWGDVSFARLLEAVARVPGIRRVRFTSPHPNDVTGELVEVMAREDTVCEQFHLPVQSGSNRVLRRMLRRYTAETFMEKVDLIRGALPDVALSTDVIVAFPGESEDDFEQTLDLLGRVRFDEAFTYRYSPREGTPATRLPAHQFIDDDVGQQRLERLIETTRSIQKEINQGEVGRVEELLIEREARSEGMVLGRTRRGKAAVVPGSKSDIGTYLTARLTRTTGPTFVGERA